MTEKQACSLPFLCDGVIQSTSEIICDCSCHRLLAKLTTVTHRQIWNRSLSFIFQPQRYMWCIPSMGRVSQTKPGKSRSDFILENHKFLDDLKTWVRILFFPIAQEISQFQGRGKKENLEYQDIVSKFFCYAKIAPSQNNFSPTPVS